MVYCFLSGFYVVSESLHYSTRVTAVLLKNAFFRITPEAEISKYYCATNSDSPEVELRFCPWLIMFNSFKYKSKNCNKGESGKEGFSD